MGRGQGRAGDAATKRHKDSSDHSDPGHEVSINASAASIHHILADLDEIHGWFPLPFKVIDPSRKTLHMGDKVKARANLAGKTIDVTIDVLADTPRHVHVCLKGPVIFDIDTRLRPKKNSCSAIVRTSCSSGGGILGGILMIAANALLNGGGLSYAVHHVRIRAERRERTCHKKSFPVKAA